MSSPARKTYGSWLWPPAAASPFRRPLTLMIPKDTTRGYACRGNRGRSSRSSSASSTTGGMPPSRLERTRRPIRLKRRKTRSASVRAKPAKVIAPQSPLRPTLPAKDSGPRKRLTVFGMDRRPEKESRSAGTVLVTADANAKDALMPTSQLTGHEDCTGRL